MNHFAVHLELTQHCKSTIIKNQKKKQTKNTNNPQRPSVMQETTNKQKQNKEIHL